MPEAELPEVMRAMSADQRAQYLEQKRQERTSLVHQIEEASARRDAYLRAAAPKAAASATSFDTKVVGSLKRAAAKSGISY